MTIVACEARSRLAVSVIDEFGSWHLVASLVETDGVTELTFVQHLDDAADVGSVGPGWEYYLDRLVASRGGAEEPVFDDYYPAQTAYYASLA